jgi:uncharacterized membrane-anchored protein
MVTPAELLAVAEEAEARATEAWWRTSASRAYYAAY